MSLEVSRTRPQPIVPVVRTTVRRQPAGQTVDRFQASPSPSGIPTRAQMMAAVRPVDETRESEIVGGNNRPGRLVQLAQGRNGATVTVHGINASPDHVGPLSQQAAQQGREVHTFAYDDRFRRLRDSSADLAQELGTWMDRNPGQPLNLRAHSMGGRVALGALAQLQEEGRLRGRPVHLDLIAPPLGGYQAADWARMDFTDALGASVPGMRPGKDMGTGSDFQQRLENLRLPENVTTRILVGDRDTVVDPNLPGFRRIAQNLRAQLIQVPGADHETIVARAAGL